MSRGRDGLQKTQDRFIGMDPDGSLILEYTDMMPGQCKNYSVERDQMALRWGICGAGFKSNDFCSAMKTLPQGENEIIAIASRSEERAKSFAEKFDIKTAYGSYDGIASNKDIDVVYIANLNNLHESLCKEMLSAGHHVLCEKPVAYNQKEVREVYQFAKEKKKFFMEAMWPRCLPTYDRIRRELESNTLGEIRLVTVQFCKRVKNRDWWIFDHELGGGCLLTWGVYPVQFANFVLNNEKPENISAVGNLNEKGVDLDGSVILQYKNGARAVLNYSTEVDGKLSAVVHGTKGSIEIEDLFNCPSEVILPSEKVSCYLPEGPVPYNYDNCSGLRYEVDHVRRCIQEGLVESPKISQIDSEAIYSIMDEIRRQVGVKYDTE